MLVSISVSFSDDLICFLKASSNQFILKKPTWGSRPEFSEKQNPSCYDFDANHANVRIWLCEEKQKQRWKSIPPQSLKMNFELKSDSWINGAN